MDDAAFVARRDMGGQPFNQPVHVRVAPGGFILRQWGIDPESYPDYETKAMQGWLDLKAAKRALWRERGYGDAYLAGQETRVRYFHEVLNDYLEGRC